MNDIDVLRESVIELGLRIIRLEKTVITAISWIAQSANSPLRADEAVRLIKMLEDNNDKK